MDAQGAVIGHWGKSTLSRGLLARKEQIIWFGWGGKATESNPLTRASPCKGCEVNLGGMIGFLYQKAQILHTCLQERYRDRKGVKSQKKGEKENQSNLSDVARGKRKR